MTERNQHEGREPSESSAVGRRALLKGAAAMVGTSAAGLAGVAVPDLGASPAQARPPQPAAGRPLIVASDSSSIVETTAGKVRGFRRSDIHTFKGLPYAGTSAGRGRFMAPTKVTPWTGVRSSMWYGPTCPQIPRSGWANDENAFLFQWDDGQPGEDCLRVNVWTPGLDTRKRPVMVWMHGGGFTAGSGQEQPAYNGESLSRRGDVVVVTLNHRLGVLGYLNLAEYRIAVRAVGQRGHAGSRGCARMGA